MSDSPSDTICSSSRVFVRNVTDARILGIGYSGINECTDPNVGYTLDTNFFGINEGNDSTRIFAKALSGSLIVNAVAAGTAGISLFFAFLAWCCSSRILEIVSS